MITKKMTLHSKVLEYLLDTVHEESIQVNINIGAKKKDFNGDIQVDVLLEYEEKDKDCVSGAITRATNMAIDYLNSNVL